MTGCECDGTGWVYFVGDYELESGEIRSGVRQARRCEGYKGYFAAVLFDLAEKASQDEKTDMLFKRPVQKGDVCKAAARRHQEIIDVQKRKGKRSKDKKKDEF